MSDEWTPYGLEAIRGRMLWRRRILAVVVFLLLAIALLAALALTATDQVVETRISLSGSESDTVEVETPGEEAFRTKPLTVAVSPGGVTLVGNDVNNVDADRLSRASVNYPYIRGEKPMNFLGLMFPWGFLLLLGHLVWSAGKGATNPSSEVNFGIYKGAMPLEMITAEYSHLVRTQRLASGSLFGKDREDHVPFAVVRRRDP